MISWTARVEWAQPIPRTDDELVALVERLHPFGGAIGTEKPAAGPGLPETWSAVISVEAGTLRQAIAAALQEVEQATGEKATAVEVLQSDEFDRRAMQPSIPELVGYAEIAEMAGITRQRAREIAETRIGFPAAVVETASGPLRVRNQVERWLETWDRRPGRPKAAV